MSKHVIFFVHGMGTHDSSWHEKSLDVIASVWKQYNNLKDMPFDEVVEAVPVVYDDTFETWRTKMKADFDSFSSALFANPGALSPEDASKAGSIEKKVSQVGKWIGAGEPEFVWSHAMDVIFYRFFLQMRTAVDVSVITQILDRINGGDCLSWSIVAHSLGTSVVHNSLNSLYGSGLDNLGPLKPSQTRPRMLMMAANVSRVLQRDHAQVYNSIVKPGSISAGRLCDYYLNVRHELDPFVQPRPFDKAPWPDPVTFNSQRYQHIRPGHITFESSEIKRVHDLDHYLENPRVHVPLFRAVLGDDDFIENPEFLQARAEFDAEQADGALDAIRDKLESTLPKASSGWQALVDLIKKTQ